MKTHIIFSLIVNHNIIWLYTSTVSGLYTSSICSPAMGAYTLYIQYILQAFTYKPLYINNTSTFLNSTSSNSTSSNSTSSNSTSSIILHPL